MVEWRRLVINDSLGFHDLNRPRFPVSTFPHRHTLHGRMSRLYGLTIKLPFVSVFMALGVDGFDWRKLGNVVGQISVEIIGNQLFDPIPVQARDAKRKVKLE